MCEIDLRDIIGTILLSTRRTLPRPISQVLLDTLATEEVEATGNRNILEAIMTDRAAQHLESHVQHGLVDCLATAVATALVGADVC